MRTLIEQEVQTPVPDEAACRCYFEQNRQRFRTPNLFEARHILLAAHPRDAERMRKAEELASAIIAELHGNPGRFPDLAALHSDCPSASQGGNLGQLGRGQTVPHREGSRNAPDRGHHDRTGPDPVRAAHHPCGAADRRQGSAVRSRAPADRRLSVRGRRAARCCTICRDPRRARPDHRHSVGSRNRPARPLGGLDATRRHHCHARRRHRRDGISARMRGRDTSARRGNVASRFNETPGEYASGAVRRFASGAGDEDWLALVGVLARSDDPGRSCLVNMVSWSLAHDKVPPAVGEHACGCGGAGQGCQG